VLKNKILNNYELKLTDLLGPGKKTTISLPGTITSDLTNIAEVAGTPSLVDGTIIPGMAEVKSTDPSIVGKLSLNPSIRVDNVAYIGRDGGKACSSAGVDFVTGSFNQNVTYCFKGTLHRPGQIQYCWVLSQFLHYIFILL
jgi:hypothetical protein